MHDVFNSRVRVVTYPESPPGTRIYPLLLAELKAHLRITDTSEDDYLQDIIMAATDAVESFLGRKLLIHELESFMDNNSGASTPWWDGTVEAPRAAMFGTPRVWELLWLPLQEVTQVSSFDWDDTEVVLDSGNYRYDAIDQDLWGRVTLKETATWPGMNFRNINAFRTLYTAGYAATQVEFKELQPKLWQGLRAAAAWMYENRGDCAEDSCIKDSAAYCILAGKRVRKV